VYQVRGFSFSSMTIVEGRTGIVLIDTHAWRGPRGSGPVLRTPSSTTGGLASSTRTATGITTAAPAPSCRRRTPLAARSRSSRPSDLRMLSSTSRGSQRT
jgi:hypothetical protein